MTNDEALRDVTFKQLGLLVGSFTSWEEDSGSQQPRWLENLMQWVFDGLPNAQFGISADGFALLYYTILRAKQNLSPEEEDDAEKIREALVRWHTPHSSFQQIEEAQTPWKECYNYPYFEPHSADLHSYVEQLQLSTPIKSEKPYFAQVPRRRNYIWLNDKDHLWWRAAIKDTLCEFKRLLAEKKLTSYEVMMLGERLECCVFAPLDILSLPLPIPDRVNDELLPSKTREELEDLVDKIYETAQKRKARYLYLSWDLFAMDLWSGYDGSEQLLYRTMLALWATWPADKIWAPEPPEELYPPSFSLDEAIFFLTELLPNVRRYFLKIKDGHQLKLTQEPFDEYQMRSYPPTFYFAEPYRRLATVDEYSEHAVVHDLLSSCLGYSDPHADRLSWSTLEGGIATIRGEAVQTDHHKPRYLLLPTSARLQHDEEIGTDLDRTVDFLSLREYTIGLEAAKIYTQMNKVISRNTGEIIDRIVQKLSRAIPALSSEERRDCIAEFTPLQLALGRIQSAFEKTKTEAIQLEQQYNAFIERTERFLDTFVIITSNPKFPSLLLAIKNAYPLRTLQSAMRVIPASTESLANNNERINSLLAIFSTVTREHERRRNEFRNVLVNALIALFGVIIGGLTLVQAISSPGSFLAFLLTRVIPNIGPIFLAVVALLFLLALLYNWPNQLNRYLVRRNAARASIEFHKAVQNFWVQSLYTTYRRKEQGCDCRKDLPILPVLDLSPPSAFRKAWEQDPDDIDTQATKKLNDLLSCLKHTGTAGSLQSHQTTKLNKLLLYLKRLFHVEEAVTTGENIVIGEDVVRMARRLIYIFVLYPELIPLPRTLCIMRYKCLYYLGKPAIREIDFHDSLICAGFTEDQVKCLQHWLEQKENQDQMKNGCVHQIAEALEEAGVKASPRKDAERQWRGNLILDRPSSYEHVYLHATKNIWVTPSLAER